MLRRGRDAKRDDHDREAFAVSDTEMPSPAMMRRVAGTDSPEWFTESGKRSVGDFTRALCLLDRDIESHRRVLDFGCGCGRVLLQLRDVADSVELYGVDIDDEVVAWTQQNVPWATTTAVGHHPPLPYPDGHFDLVVNHSVFTHLPENYQDEWLADLQRVVSPGGTLLLSVNGPHSFEAFATAETSVPEDIEPSRAVLRDHGLLYLDDPHWAQSPVPDFYRTTFHAPWYVFEHWGELFDVRAYISRGALDYQDLVVLRRR